MKRLTNEEFLKRFYATEKHKNIKVLEKYVNMRTKIALKCNICQNEWSARPMDLINQNQGCRECYLNERYQPAKKYLPLFKNFNLLDRTTSKPNYFSLSCKKCGYQFLLRRDAVHQGIIKCSLCEKNMSKGEKATLKILQKYLKNKYKIKREYIFSDLKNKTNLRFDFAILKNNSLLFLVEVHGRQHFDETSWFEYDVKYHDKLKQEYCNKNNIPLLTLKYHKQWLSKKNIKEWENQIKNFLKKMNYIG